MTILLYELVGVDPERRYSPHCWKTRMALAHKGLQWVGIPTRFTDIETVEGGGHATIPVLRDKGTVVRDSFAIAEYLEDAYPDLPSLFGGPGGRAMARFVESWSQRTVHPYLVSVIILDVFEMQDEENRNWFRARREAAFGRPLDEIQDGRGADRLAAFSTSLEPLRVTLRRQPFLGGETPLFADHIVFGAFQWWRVSSPFRILAPDDIVSQWFERCLDLYGGEGRRVAAAA